VCENEKKDGNQYGIKELGKMSHRRKEECGRKCNCEEDR
jgi:hypothetical protein